MMNIEDLISELKAAKKCKGNIEVTVVVNDNVLCAIDCLSYDASENVLMIEVET